MHRRVYYRVHNLLVGAHSIWQMMAKIGLKTLRPRNPGVISGDLSRISAKQHLPEPKTENDGYNERGVLRPVYFIGMRTPIWLLGTHMTMSISVKWTDFVPSEAIPRGISYLGTKGGSDDKIAFSSFGGALATLKEKGQTKTRQTSTVILTSCSNMRSQQPTWRKTTYRP